jgi:hypothetical protein
MDQIHSIAIDEIVSERWHFDGRFCAAEPKPKHGMTGVLRAHNVSIGVAQDCEGRAKIDDVLVSQTCIITSVVVTNAPWLMAPGTVGIQIGAGAFGQRGLGIGEGGKPWIIVDGGFINGRAEKANPVQGANLVVGDSLGAISEFAVELAGIDAEHIAGNLTGLTAFVLGD